jgi:hypothetical protein
MGTYELHAVTIITGISDEHNGMKYDVQPGCAVRSTQHYELVREVVLILGVGIRSRKIS